MADVLVTERLEGSALEELCRRFNVHLQPDLWNSPEELRARVADCRALLVRNQTRVTRDLLSNGTRLEIVARAGAGLDNVDVGAATDAGILVTSAPEQNAISVAELSLGMMLTLARKIAGADHSTKDGNWDRHRFTGTELFGKTVGIVGFGRIGFLVAMRARAFGMRVLAYDPFASEDSVTVIESGASIVPIDELLSRSDVVSIHLPGNAATRKFFDRERLRMMRPTAILLNMARGEVLDEEALIEALKGGRLAGAGLDVRAAEPPAASPLDSMDNVILTPHVAAFTDEAQTRVVAAVCRDITQVLSGGTAMYPANVPRKKP
jgi:D-3-phosphoglycerate dehydrogenase